MEQAPKSSALFSETPEMRSLRYGLTPDSGQENFRVNLSQYQKMAEERIDKLPNELRSRAQIELIIITAKIYAQVGRDNTDVLEDALSYAEGIGDYDLVDQIEELLKQRPKQKA